MEISTVVCIIIVAAILGIVQLLSKEIDLRKPPSIPEPRQSDIGMAIDALERELTQLNSFYEEDNDQKEVLVEIGKISAALIQIATRERDNVCKCGGKKS